MKTHCKQLATTLAALLAIPLLAAVPIAWTNSPGMPPYAVSPIPHGSTIDFSVTLKGYTSPPIVPGADLRLWYQTNGMGSAWFYAPASINSNVITATFGPAQDVGADRVSLFFGAPSNVFASAVLRLTPSPGFAPNSLPFPAPVLDFSTVDVRNIGALTNGWSFGTATDLSPATNYTDRSISSFAATGTVARASSYGTPTRWTDATGCVWEVKLARGGTPVSETPGATWSFYDYWDSMELGKAYMTLNGVGWEEYTNLDDGWESFTFDQYATRSDYGSGSLAEDVTFTRPLVLVTNLVGRVALTNDIPAVTEETDPTVPDWAKEPEKPEYTPAEIGAAPATITNALPDMVARAVYDVHDLKWDEEESILYWCRMVGGHDLCIAVTNVDLTHPTNSAALKAWREANR